LFIIPYENNGTYNPGEILEKYILAIKNSKLYAIREFLVSTKSENPKKKSLKKIFCKQNIGKNILSDFPKFIATVIFSGGKVQQCIAMQVFLWTTLKELGAGNLIMLLRVT